MKIILAPDKFKNSLTGLQFCEVVQKRLEQSIKNVEVIKLPLADGGDGTIDVINFYLEGEPVKVNVSNPFFKTIQATYLYAEQQKIAFIEMAEASGVKLLEKEDFDCLHSTTLGTGQLILNAIKKGAKEIILGIGGSATNDCGIGMATALGYRFLDKDNNVVKPIGKNLALINKIDDTNVLPELKHVAFKIACDVSNPLHGENGAAYVYAPQKGASPKDVLVLDKGLKHFSKHIDNHFNIDSQSISGAGAAGGMGIGSVVFLGGNLQPGIQLVLELAKFNTKVKNADWIITGEGKLDQQTLSGKTIQGVLNIAQKHQIKTAAFCGSVDLSEPALKTLGVSYADAVINYAKNIDDAMKNSSKYLDEITLKFSEVIND